MTWVESRSQREGYALVVGNTHRSKAQEDLMVVLFRRRVDGLILGPCEVEHSEYLAFGSQKSVCAAGVRLLPSGNASSSFCCTPAAL